MNRRVFAQNVALSAGSVFLPAEAAPELPKSVPYGKVADAHMHLRLFEAKTGKPRAEVIERCLQVQEENLIWFGLNIGVTGDDAFYRETRFDHPTPIQGDWKIDGIGFHNNIIVGADCRAGHHRVGQRYGDRPDRGLDSLGFEKSTG